jgi:hypothetical protein
MISDELFKTALAEAETRLDKLLTEQAAIEQRHAEIDIEIAKLTDKICHLAALTSDVSFKARFMRSALDIGLNNNLTSVLQATEEPLTVAEIKDRLKSFGYNETTQKNLLATLHVMLERMKKADQVIQENNAQGRKAFKWNPNYKRFRITLDRKLLEEAIKNPRDRKK